MSDVPAVSTGYEGDRPPPSGPGRWTLVLATRHHSARLNAQVFRNGEARGLIQFEPSEAEEMEWLAMRMASDRSSPPR